MKINIWLDVNNSDGETNIEQNEKEFMNNKLGLSEILSENLNQSMKQKISVNNNNNNKQTNKQKTILKYLKILSH